MHGSAVYVEQNNKKTTRKDKSFMSLEVIRNEKELVEAFFNTNLNDSVAVTELTQDIKNNCFVDGKNSYLGMLSEMSSDNIRKAQKYAKLSEDDQNTLKKNKGWIVMGAIIAIEMVLYGGDFDAIPDLGLALAWIGISMQIYIYYIKSVWKKLTLEGTAVHPMLRANGGVASNTMTAVQSKPVDDTNNHPENKQGKSTCKFCGNELKPGARFCANCGKEQK